ncbi:MAG: glycosyltransferase, partial [Candidatus Dormibacteraeota bacterium]|nr:glycosyltransferase [Candidatus Dormibacteraeota bacterium]
MKAVRRLLRALGVTRMLARLAPWPAGEDVHAQIDTWLPPTIPSTPSTLYIAGWCFHQKRRIRRLDLIANGVGQRVVATRMPRYDVHRHFLSRNAASRRAYRSGFWTIATLEPSGSDIDLTLRARMWLRGFVDVPIATLQLEGQSGNIPYPERPSHDRGEPQIAVCMATYEPDLELFNRQIGSLRAQTHANWICIINDDSSSREVFAQMAESIDGDARFSLRRNQARLGFCGNFEAALRRVPHEAAYVAFADQDDCWYPEKLEALLAELQRTGAALAYSDMRIVLRDGEILEDTFWRYRRNNFTDVADLLLANTVTGAASLFSSRLLRWALPFPRYAPEMFHDHWLAAIAISTGGIAYVDRPLLNYVQHSRNALGYLAGTGALEPVDTADADPERSSSHLKSAAAAR